MALPRLRPKLALPSTLGMSAMQIITPCRLAVKRPRFQLCRQYTIQTPKPSGNSTLLYGGQAVTILAGGGFYAYGLASTAAQPVAMRTGKDQDGTGDPISSDTQRTSAISTPMLSAKSDAYQTVASFFTPSKDDYQDVYDAIAQKLLDDDDYDDGSYGPVVLRLGWHSSGTYDKETNTGGSNGATMRFQPEGGHGANTGLKNARDFLEPIHERFPWITYSDLWTLAAVCALQEMSGPDVLWRPGRHDHDITYCTPDGRLPDGSKNQDHLRAIFGRMGFNDEDIVALSGAHAVGRCHTNRSGFDGPWTFSPITFTNDYYKLLLEEKWTGREWSGPAQFQDLETKSLMMLPTDMSLIKDEGFRRFVEKYAFDQDVFFEDFAKGLTKLFELGVPFTTGEDARMLLRRTE